jgi:glycosyltransferase involved in cell wall biosynthesis
LQNIPCSAKAHWRLLNRQGLFDFMRICHVIESAGGGSGQVVLDLASYGLSQGDAITVVYAPERAAPDFIAELESLRGVKILTTPMHRSVGPHDARDAFELLKLLRSAGPFDVVHSHSSKAGALARMTGLFLRPRPVQIYTPHAFVTLAPDVSPVYAWLEKTLSWFGDKIVALSAVEERHATQKLHIAPHKLAVVPNGIRLNDGVDRADGRKSLGMSENEFVVGVVGRMVAQKNPLRAIEAFKLLLAKHPEARLVILGDGPLQDAVDEALAQPALAGKAQRIAGQRGRDLIPGFDVLLCASDYEGFAVTFLEALAAGVPIVATPVGGAKETVRDGISGFIASLNPVDLAAALARIADMSADARNALSLSTRNIAEEFTVEVMGRRIKAVYETALAARRKNEKLVASPRSQA